MSSERNIPITKQRIGMRDVSRAKPTYSTRKVASERKKEREKKETVSERAAKRI